MSDEHTHVPSFVKSGRDGINEPGEGTGFVTLKDGDVVEAMFVTGIEGFIHFYQHRIWIDAGNSPIFPCFQTTDCPGCKIGDKPGFRGLSIVKLKGEDEQKIFPMGIQMYRQLMEIEDTIGSLKGAVVRLSRRGSGATTTKYNAIFTGKTIPNPGNPEINLVEFVGETNKDTIIEHLIKVGKWLTSPASAGDEEEVASDDPWDKPEFK